MIIVQRSARYQLYAVFLIFLERPLRREDGARQKELLRQSSSNSDITNRLCSWSAPTM